MILLIEKQKIILDYYQNGKSQRTIHRETGISRKTIRKYIREYDEKKAELLSIGDISAGELIQMENLKSLKTAVKKN